MTKKRTKELFKHWQGRERTAEEFASGELDGSDYERGELETIKAEAGNVKEAFARLIGILHARGDLNEFDVHFIVKGYIPREHAEEAPDYIPTNR